MEASGGKDVSIYKVLSKLRDLMGTTAFDIVDPWETDATAIGIARPDNHSVLVYISTASLPDGGYFASLELAPLEKDFPYQNAGEFHDVDFEGLAEIVKQHLQGS